MRATEYRAWLDLHALTHEAAGRALRVHKSTSKRYSDGTIEIPLTIALAIAALDVAGDSIDSVLGDGESRSDFVRDAVKRELERRRR
ncbi:YlcI/YnfO family protein [Bosea sp. 2YAB26]|uniref:YlcI/YnfO family protein n=1 Tax=Bosea sp. 2YAB26 TaxID=3237478 RepID=UPI003F920B5E